MDGQEVLDHMNDLVAELDVQPAEADVARALRAANRAQDLLELTLAILPPTEHDLAEFNNVSTATDTERTAVPTGTLSVYRCQFIDPDTSRPSRNLDTVDSVGDASLQGSGLANLFINQVSTPGPPRAYTRYGGFLYWDPLPDAIHTIRVWGFVASADIAVGTDFTYPDFLAWPVAAVASKIFKMRAEDSIVELGDFAAETFGPAVAFLASGWKDGATYHRYL